MKKITAMIILAFTVMLTGCGASVPEMNEEQSALVTEYAANLLIKYNNAPSRNLLNEEQLAQAEAEEEAEREKERKKEEAAQAYLAAQENANNEDSSSGSGTGDGSSSSENVISNLASFYGMDDFSIQYSSYELCASYPDESREDFFLAMDATQGNQLFILKFLVSNVSGGEAEFDMFAKQGVFYINMNGMDTIPQQSTLLLDDLASYKGMIAADASEEMVLVFEVPDSVTSIDSMELIARYGSERGAMTIQ